jgi:hypothetical protein
MQGEGRPEITLTFDGMDFPQRRCLLRRNLCPLHFVPQGSSAHLNFKNVVQTPGNSQLPSRDLPSFG